MEVAVTTSQEITTFQDEQQPLEGKLADPIGVPEPLEKSFKESTSHDVVSFLERPYKIGNFEWASTSTPKAQLFQLSFPDTLFSIPAIRDKLQGFTYFKADMEFRVQVNAQPFQQGRLMFTFIPYQELWNTDPVDGYSWIHTSVATLTGLSGYPRTELDLGETQSMTFKVPFVCPFSALDLTMKRFSVGTIACWVYSPLRGGDQSVFGTVWGRFTNVKIELPTGTPAYTPVTQNAEFQGVHEEARIVSTGPISSVADKVGKVAMAAKDIPFISNVASTVATASGVVSRVASLFGLSKPSYDMPVNPVVVSTVRNMANYDGPDHSKTLALASTNSLSRAALFGSKVDESSIRYIAGTPNYLTTLTWNVSQAPETKLVPENNIGVCPTLCGTDSNIGTNLAPTHLAYVSSMFKYWRGSLKYKLKFVKTKFHSGRLSLTLVPNYHGTNCDEQKCYRQILDIQERSEFDFEVPYACCKDWVSVSDLKPFGGLMDTRDVPFDVIIRVLNPLRRPNELVSDVVDIILEVSAGDDFEVAVPVVSQYLPVTKSYSAPSEEPFEFQSGWNMSTRHETQLGFDNPESLYTKNYEDNDDHALFNVGEKVVSINQLLKRFVQPSVDYAGQFRGSYFASLTPYAVQTAGAGDNVNDTGYVDYYSMFAHIFAYQRGSMRVKYYSNTYAAPIGSVTIQPLNAQPYQFYLGTNLSLCGPYCVQPRNDCPFVKSESEKMLVCGGAQALSFAMRDGVVEVEWPYYNMVPFVPSAAMSLKSYPTNEEEVTFLPKLYVRDYTMLEQHGAALDQNFYRAVGDDFQFGFLIGCPLLKKSILNNQISFVVLKPQF